MSQYFSFKGKYHNVLIELKKYLEPKIITFFKFLVLANAFLIHLNSFFKKLTKITKIFLLNKAFFIN